MSAPTTNAPHSAPATLDPSRVNVRIKIAGLWTAMMLVFAYVDLFSLYRADVRADLEAGQLSAFTVGPGFLLGVTAYVAIPSAMVFLSLVLPARVARVATIVLATAYLVTVVAGAVGESAPYYLLGSVLEVAALAALVGYAWTWPKVASPTG
jgi:hypothetical protein